MNAIRTESLAGRAPRLRAELISLAVAAALSLIAASAEGATITVTTNLDDTALNGNCTLREAVLAANANADVDLCVGSGPYGNDTIVLPAGIYVFAVAGNDESGTPSASVGDLDVTESLTIQGDTAATTIIDGNALDRLFQVFGGTVTINDVTIRHGQVGSGIHGGAINVCDATLNLNRSIVEANVSGGRGGGIFVCFTATLVIDSSVVRDNSAGDHGGGIAQHLSPSTVTITNSTISNNSSSTYGGGIQSFSDLTILNTTFSGNFAVGSAGGILHTAGTLTLSNSTLSGNHTRGGGGGADLAGSAVQNLNNVTITNNTADEDGDGSEDGTVPGSGGGLVVRSPASVNVKNTIIAGNVSLGATPGPDCYGTLNSQAYNFFGDPTGCAIGGDTTGNQTGDPKLGGLTSNGGLTQTHALQTGSLAIDGGNPGVPGSGGSTCIATDQRGTARPVDGNSDSVSLCDIGAFESDESDEPDTTPPVITPTVTGTLGSANWYVSNVSVTWSVVDNESPISSTTGCGATNITTDTTGTTLPCSATSAGGTSNESVTIKRDTTPPSSSAVANPPPNPSNWRKTNVTVSFSGNDALTGAALCDDPVLLASDGPNQSASGHCYDAAGNQSALATASGINIDKTPPTAVAKATPPPNAAGWRNKSVTITFSGVDALSGIAGCDSAVITAEGPNLGAAGYCYDVAGNQSALAPIAGINIDKTNPTIAVTLPVDGAVYNRNQVVTVTFSCGDVLSTIASCVGSVASGATLDTSKKAQNAKFTVTATDKAGNTTKTTVTYSVK